MSHPRSVRGPLGGWEQLVARQGELLRVELTDTEIAVVVEAASGNGLARASIPYPMLGCAGHELLLSASERYLAMFLWSGQSEIGYELFYFRPQLQHICSFGYELGEGSGPVFSSDERRLGLVWATNPLLSLVDEDFDNVEHLPTGECLADWARLRIQQLPDGPAMTCRVRVRVPPGFPLEGNDSFYPEHLEIGGEDARFQTSWGEQVHVPLPLSATLVIPGPQSR